MEIEKSVTQKQEYLTQEIIQGGYDSQMFVEYISTLKEKGEDISMWSMEELQKVVNNFKNKYKILPLFGKNEETFPVISQINDFTKNKNKNKIEIIEEKLGYTKSNMNYILPIALLPKVGIINENEFRQINEKTVETNKEIKICSNLYSSSDQSQNVITFKGQSDKIKDKNINEDLISNAESNPNLLERNNPNPIQNNPDKAQGNQIYSQDISNLNQLNKEQENDSEIKINSKENLMLSSSKIPESNEIKKVEKNEDLPENFKTQQKFNSNNEASSQTKIIFLAEGNNQDNIQQNQNLETNLPENSQVQNNGVSIYLEEMSPFIETNSIVSNGLNSAELKVQIVDFRLTKDGFFSKNHLEFLIHTMPLESSVYRRYSHFKLFRETLINLYPGYIIPPLPPSFGNDSLKANKRKLLMQKFLDLICEIKVFKSSFEFYNFLTIKDGDELIKFLKDAGSKPVSSIKNTINLYGKAKLDFESNLENYDNEIGMGITNINESFSKIKVIQKEILKIYLIISNKFNTISQLYESISEQYKKLEITKMSNLINSLSSLNKKQGSYFFQEIGIIKENLIHTMKSVFQELQAINENQRQVDTLKKKFYYMEQALTKKKEYLFNNPFTFQFWDIPTEVLTNKEFLIKNRNLAFKNMLSKETTELLRTKEFYGYCLNKLKEDFLFIMERHYYEMKNNLSAYSKFEYSLFSNVELISLIKPGKSLIKK